MFVGVNIVGACSGMPDGEIMNNKLNSTARWQIAGILVDTLVSLTALAVGIAGLVGALQGLPPAACWTLIGVSMFISLTWLFLTIVTEKNGENLFADVKDLLLSAIGCPSQQEN